MSKNVAVFVDVANIFYAAKAAGVDIDYVTLLKSASAGRDLVRAYAYTGLDPENENQRQFHSFLARNGYKVVSKDIRKYGDGKVKANLDIELVVDLMRTSHNLDIAVVVSGDGDFAPAIRAVQQTGVRVEVISFRGNTSSDLIEVADVFTDITQIARVERSSRSGRRVAAEEDLSMTEVPEKETEGASQRRRRARRGEGREEPRRERERHEEAREGGWRERRAAAAAASAPGGTPPIMVLPGEKLSKVAPPVATAIEEEVAVAELAEETEAPFEVVEGEVLTEQEGGRHRRRRRGGRGRGRGRGGDGVPVDGVPAEEGEPEEELEPEVPLVPQHSTFGSVWDSQLGMPHAPVAGVAGGEADEEELEEPEIPEYLLAERRQRGGGRGGRGGGRRGRGSAYQQAVERERYGRGSTAPIGGIRREQRPGGPGRPPSDRDRGERGRPPRDSQMEERGPGGEPWSEVPPEVAELLRAELARRGGQIDGRGPARPGTERRQGGGQRPGRGGRAPAAALIAEPAGESGPLGPAAGEPVPAVAPGAGQVAEEGASVAIPSRSRRGRRPAGAEVRAAAVASGVAGAVPTVPALGAVEAHAPTDRGPATVEAGAPPSGEPVSAGASRARRTRRGAAGAGAEAPEGTTQATAGEAHPIVAPTAARTTRRRTGAAAGAAGDGVSATRSRASRPAGTGGDAQKAATPRRRTAKTTASTEPEETAGGGEATAAPRRRTRRSPASSEA